MLAWDLNPHPPEFQKKTTHPISSRLPPELRYNLRLDSEQDITYMKIQKRNACGAHLKIYYQCCIQSMTYTSGMNKLIFL